jgi:hypothetical protein
MKKARIGINDFWLGFICGALVVILITGFIVGLVHFNKKNKEKNEYAEKQIELQELRESVINTPSDEFLEMPDVRRAVDGATAEFERGRDEALFRFRSRNSN